MIRMGSSRRDRTGRSKYSVSSILVVQESSGWDRRDSKLHGSKDRKWISRDSKAQHVTKYKPFREFVLARMISWILLFMVPFLPDHFLMLGVKPFTVEYNVLKLDAQDHIVSRSKEEI